MQAVNWGHRTLDGHFQICACLYLLPLFLLVHVVQIKTTQQVSNSLGIFHLNGLSQLAKGSQFLQADSLGQRTLLKLHVQQRSKQAGEERGEVQGWEQEAGGRASLVIM